MAVVAARSIAESLVVGLAATDGEDAADAANAVDVADVEDAVESVPRAADDPDETGTSYGTFACAVVLVEGLPYATALAHRTLESNGEDARNCTGPLRMACQLLK